MKEICGPGSALWRLVLSLAVSFTAEQINRATEQSQLAGPTKVKIKLTPQRWKTGLTFSPLKQRLGWLVGENVIHHPTLPTPGLIVQSSAKLCHPATWCHTIWGEGSGGRLLIPVQVHSQVKWNRKRCGQRASQARGDSPPHPRTSQASLPASDSVLPTKIPAPPPQPGFPLQSGHGLLIGFL